MGNDWIRSEILGKFEEFMVAICIDEVIGDYEMRFGFFNANIEEYIIRTHQRFNEKKIRSIKSKSLYLFADDINNYIIDKRIDFPNLIISREDRTGRVEDEIYGLFNAYKKVKDSLIVWAPELSKFDNYLNNFGMEDLIRGETNILVYNQFEEFALAFIERKDSIKNTMNPYERMFEIFKTPSTKEEVTDLMLGDISKLKNSVKKGDGKSINLYSRNIRNYSRILDYDPTSLLESMIKKD